MDSTEYFARQYRMTVKDADELTLDKSRASDWASLTMHINDGVPDTQITLRSKEIAEGLHFMLGQMLGKS